MQRRRKYQQDVLGMSRDDWERQRKPKVWDEALNNMWMQRYIPRKPRPHTLAQIARVEREALQNLVWNYAW